MANVRFCGIVVSEFEFQSHYHFHFQSNIMGTQLISKLKNKELIFVQKSGSRSCHFCICIFEFIDQSAHSS